MTSALADRRVRPRNRRELIAEAAGRAFSTRGYHAVGMDDIAASVGITAAALYRHYPNKYALFVHCATRLADGLEETLDALPAGADLDTMLRAVARTTVARRATGGIHRWEARYLEAPDREALRTTFDGVVRRVAAAVTQARAEAGRAAPDSPDPADAWLHAAAALGAIGSATAHRTTVGARRLEGLLAAAAHRTALGPASGPSGGAGPASHGDAPAPEAADPSLLGDGRSRGGRRAEILAAAIPLFHRDGYAEASMGDIARAVGLTPSGLYRHYSGKADILLAACLEAADLLQAAVDRELAAAATPSDVLGALARAYVGYSFEHTALTSVATAELGGLPAETQRPLRAAQREHVGRWEEALREAQPGLAVVDARVLVHAALGVVTEAGRALHWEDTPEHRVLVADLALAALGV